MHRLALALLTSAGLAIAACGGATAQTDAVQETSLAPEPSTSDESPTSSSGSGLSASPEKMPALPKGTIRRADLLRVLDKGPGALLAMVETLPYRENGRFVGFQIARFTTGAPRAVDLRDGDVILTVNGLAIATPDDFYRIFQELKGTSEIKFDIQRDNVKASFSYPVVE
jgi:type II secretory pathway component PulC